jgi:hypothetical protein
MSARGASRGRILLGLTSPNYFSGFSPFLNWWKLASAPVLTRSSGPKLSGRAIWDEGGYLDTLTGEIIRPTPPDLISISRTFFKSTNHFQVEAGCNYFGERWIAKWEGSAVGHMVFESGGGSQVRVGPNEIHFVTGQDPDKVGLTLTIIDANNPPRNILIFQARYQSNVASGEKFNPDWLAQIRRFGCLRFMGWMPTNNETISDFTQLADEDYFAWSQPFESLTENGDYGPKGSIHPRLICELANLTGCNIHVCIPVRATDAFVKSFAGYFKDNTKVEVTFELCNECWNSIFTQYKYCLSQGSKIWPHDRAAHLKWYGKRSAECMKIVSDVYNDRGRWDGALATQVVDPEKTLQILAGVEYWRSRGSEPPNSMAVSELFGGLYVTGYFGDIIPAATISSIEGGDPPIVRCRAHGFKNGQKIKLFLTDGPIQLSDRFFTVATVTQDTFELRGVSTGPLAGQLPLCQWATSQALPFSKYENGASGGGATLAGDPGDPLLIDGARVALNDIILVKDQDARSENGIYRVIRVGDRSTGWLIMRASYFDQEGKMLVGSAVRVTKGVHANQLFILGEAVETVGRSEIKFKAVESRNYAADAALFEVMEKSSSRHFDDNLAYPTKYTYFNQQVSRALIDGYCDDRFTVSGSIKAVEDVFWPQQLAIARKNHLALRQYEGGCGISGGLPLLGDPRTLIYCGNEQFGEYIFNLGHSVEVAAAYARVYSSFWRIGGQFPAKFVADGRSSNAGTWAGVRFWPLQANQNKGDIDNPVWITTLAANGA